MATMESATPGTWSMQQSHRIGSALGEFEGKEMLLDSGAGIVGVQTALQALSQNPCRIACESGVCIVFSEQQKLYFLLWRSDVKETVYEKYGFYDPADPNEPGPDAVHPTPPTVQTTDERPAVNVEEVSAVAPSTVEPHAVPAVETNNVVAVESNEVPAVDSSVVPSVEPCEVPAVVNAEEPHVVPAADPPSPSRAIANVVDAEDADGTTYFNVSVSSPGKSHIVRRRYREFRSLKEQVGDTAGQAFPRKHLLPCRGAKLDTRRNQLDQWLQSSLRDRSVDDLPAPWADFLELSPAQAA